MKGLQVRRSVSLPSMLALLLVSAVLAGCGGEDGDAPEVVPTSPLPQSPFQRPRPGLDAVTDVAALPILRPGSVARQVSSHDRTGGNDDGFTVGTQLYVDEHGEYVVFDDYGPGCVYRMWFTSVRALLGGFGNIRIYVDDLETPVVDTPFLDLFQSRVPPFLSPLTNAFGESSGGFVSYVPICYARRARITLTEPSEFYNITYRRYDLDQTVVSFTGGEDYALLFEQWTHPRADPKSPLQNSIGAGLDVETLSGSLDLPPGKAGEILDRSGFGAIWNLSLDVDPFREESLAGLWLLAAWDGHATPDVEAPVGEFFGSVRADAPCRGLLIGRGADRFTCRLPMPFRSRAKVWMENRGAATTAVTWEIELLDAPYPEPFGTFTTVRRTEDPTTLARDYLFARTDGAGHYIGVTYTMSGPRPGTYMEGDERFYVNGSRSPSLYGTGTEDYFNGGWYFVLGPFSLPLHGSPFRLQRIGEERSRTGCYRMHVGDLVPFLRGAELGIEHDASNEETTDAHTSVTYLYRYPKPLLTRTDTLDLSDPASRRAHAYDPLDGAPTGEITSAFEGTADDVQITDSGYEIPEGSAFVLRVDPRNEGVILRRHLDQARGRQLARVLVDGAVAGTWYDVYENPVLRWAESELPLPASLTAGKESLDIEVKNLGEAPWSEFAYEALSYVPPGP